MDESRWIANSYCSTHSILLIGEGDFSFSLSLAKQFGSARHMVATTRDNKDNLMRKYKFAKSNVSKLKQLDATVLLEVDATNIAHHPNLSSRKFDRIIYNFPHVGFIGKEKDNEVIGSHQNLVKFFLKQAGHLIRPDGEIHISHKTTGPFIRWDLPYLGSRCSLYLSEQVDFNIEDFPGYHNKRGSGKDCDKSFPLGKCSIFKFKLLTSKPRGERSQDSIQPSFQNFSRPPPDSSRPPYHSQLLNQFQAPSSWTAMSNFDLRHRLNMKKRLQGR